MEKGQFMKKTYLSWIAWFALLPFGACSYDQESDSVFEGTPARANDTQYIMPMGDSITQVGYRPLLRNALSGYAYQFAGPFTDGDGMKHFSWSGKAILEMRDLVESYPVDTPVNQVVV